MSALLFAIIGNLLSFTLGHNASRWIAVGFIAGCLYAAWVEASEE